MKGKVFLERKHKVEYPVSIDIKYDEVRCHVKVTPEGVTFLSYAEKPLANMQEFAPLFQQVARITGFTEFDCGFEVNENFNDTYRWVRSTKKLPDDLSKATWRFFLFDLPELCSPYKYRLGSFREVADAASTWYLPGSIQLPERLEAQCEQDVYTAFEYAVSTGREGIMVKSYDHLYQRGKRIDGWWKFKPEETADGEIIALNRAYAGVDQPELGIRAGDPLDRIGSVTVRLEDGSEASPHGIPHDLGRDMLLNPQAYMHEWVEFKYMMIDRQGGYRHCVFKRLREAKK